MSICANTFWLCGCPGTALDLHYTVLAVALCWPNRVGLFVGWSRVVFVELLAKGLAAAQGLCVKRMLFGVRLLAKGMLGPATQSLPLLPVAAKA